MVRESFGKLINVLSKKFTLGKTWESAHHFILNLREHKNAQPDLVLIDYKMPGLNGGKLSYLLQRDFPHINKLGMSSDTELSWIEEFVYSGCKGFVSKGDRPDELKEAIETALSNQYYHNFYVTKQLTKKLVAGKVDYDFPYGLNDNQYLYCYLILTSLTNKQMAEVLNIKEETLHKMQQRLFSKFNVTSKGELISCLLTNKIVKQF